MKLSVIICCYNAAATIGETLEAFIGQEWDEEWEIIIANNRSTDASLQVVQRYGDLLSNLRIVDASERQGQPFAANTGVQAAHGESVAFCDADDVVAPGWVEAMGNALAKHDFVAAAMECEKLNAPWIVEGRGRPQSTGLQIYHYPPYLPHAGGGTIGVKRRLYLELGGFDETLPILHDTDFCWRLQRHGVKLHFVPEAVIHIRFRPSFKAIYRQSKGYGYYNVMLYKRYRRLDMPRLSRKRGFRAWWRLATELPRLRTKAQRARWVRDFGWRVGRLQGSIDSRTLAL